MTMDRIKVIIALMKFRRLNNYFEIGVHNGHVLFKIRSNFKIAVDPDFVFDFFRKAGKILMNPCNLFNQYFEKTSDDFFRQDAERVFATKKVQIALIDGLHQYDYALRDIENTLKYLSDDGVILVHDCNPLSQSASSTWEDWQASGEKGFWNGDVWKAIVHLRSTRNDINIFVLDCDHGLGVVTKGLMEKPLSYQRERIEKLTYSELAANREQLLNLKPADYFYNFFLEK
jgi:Methyltransferase domain